MTRAELRRQLRERKAELRRRMAELRESARERTAELPAVRRRRRRRRIRRAAAVASILLLALLVRCQCAEAPPEPAPPPPGPAPVAQAGPAAEAPSPEKPLRDRMSRQRRGSYAGGPRATPSWLEEFHLQVSARSPRLAECFTGADRPGAIRWAAALNAKSGAVSDHELEPLGPAADLTVAQRDCVVRVLSSPTYRLNVPEAQALPSRVGLVIEF